MPTIASITEPVWTSPSLEGLYSDTVFSEWFLDPDHVSALLVRFLQYVFSDADRIVKARAKTLLYSADKQVTKLKIQSGYFDADSLAGSLPGIYIVRKETKNIAGVVDPDVCSIAVNGQVNKVWSRFWQYTVQIRCESRKPDEAELICQEVSRQVSVFGPVFKNDARLQSFEVSSVPGVVKQESGWFTAGVLITWCSFSQFAIAEEEPW